MNNILFIVEGEVDEVNILGNNTKGLLSLVDVNANVVSVANPIYELYDFLHKDEYEDIVSYLKYKKKIEIDRTKGAFSAIYLVFDFEHHYKKYSDEKICEMLKFFNDETENGKLYISYPMIEALYHLKSIPDNDYINRKVDLRLIENSGKEYKILVNNESCLKKFNITKHQYIEIIKNNYNKAIKITKPIDDQIDYLKLLEYEISCANEKQFIDVLSTLPLFITDNYMDLISDEF